MSYLYFTDLFLEILTSVTLLEHQRKKKAIFTWKVIYYICIDSHLKVVRTRFDRFIIRNYMVTLLEQQWRVRGIFTCKYFAIYILMLGPMSLLLEINFWTKNHSLNQYAQTKPQLIKVTCNFKFNSFMQTNFSNNVFLFISVNYLMATSKFSRLYL